jgi:DNA-binding IclR family transcriptional regulator
MTAILEAFDEDDHGLRLSEVAARADLPKSTVSRLVSTLVREHYLERDGRVIHLGLRLFELGQLADEPRELRAAALPVMADLRNRTGEIVSLALRDGREMVCIAVVRGQTSATPTSRIGGRIPTHATALGKAVLAFSDDADVAAVLSSGLAPWTSQTITDPQSLIRELSGVRQTGLALEVGEFVEASAAVASPVFSPSGALLGAISVSGRAGDFDPERSGPSVRAAAVALTRRLASGAIAPA